MIKKLFFLTLLVVFFLAISPVMGKVEAGYFKFDNNSYSATAEETFDVAVDVDSGSDQISSVDVYINFDTTLFEVQSITDGTFFPTVTNNISSGQVYVAGMVDDPASSKTGSGTVATMTVKALKNGSGTFSFDCDASKIVKNDLNATNVLDCSLNQEATVAIGDANNGSSSASPTVVPTAPVELPRSGVFENVVHFAIPGAILLIVGSLARLLI